MSTQPFKVSEQLSRLKGAYPSAREIINVVSHGRNNDAEAIARLWISEGIPYAFRENPGLYEAVRLWLATHLDIDPKEISISGSARIGESLAPKKLGTKFGKHSDLDLFVVSEKAFIKLSDEFLNWSNQYEKGSIKPTNSIEAKFWAENVTFVPKNLSRGFIDKKFIPNYPQFEYARKWANCEFLLTRKLSATRNGLKLAKASFRCYRDWSSFVRQVSLSLKN